ELYPHFASGQTHRLSDAPENYSAFVARQAKLTASERGRGLVEHWRDRLNAIRPVLQWQTDFERPVRFSHRAAVQPLEFSPSIASKVTAAAKRWNVTSNVVMMAALQVLISRWTGQDSFSIGTPFSGRSDQQFERTVGFFVNVLPIGAELSDNPTFQQLVQSVSGSMIDALVHEELPFSEIVRNCAPGRDPSRHPLFQVSCTFEKSHVESEQGRAGFLFGSVESFEDFAGMRQESYFVPHPTCHYDVEFVFELADSAVHGMICYCRDLFAKDTIESMATQFPRLLETLLERPTVSVKQLPWNIPAEPIGQDVSSDDNMHHSVSAAATVPMLLSESKDKIVEDARRFADVLREGGVQESEFVPVCMPKGDQAWVAILGVMMAGACPIPLDAQQPSVSMKTLVDDAQVSHLVADANDITEKVSGLFFHPRDCENSSVSASKKSPDTFLGAEALAYVVYTSGSTGKPKGVMVPHRAIANTLAWRKRVVTLSSQDRVLVLLSHQFDAAMAVVLSCLHQGAHVVWPEQEQLDLDALIDQLIRDRITVLPAIPNLTHAIASHPRFSQCKDIRQVWCGGEAITAELVQLIRSKIDCEVWNFYGPTEAAVEATAHRIDEVDARRSIPIGRPIDNAEVLIVDEAFNVLPSGVAGQLVIGGNGLADGYLNRPDETKRAFVNLAGQRFYLTGDRARKRGDGSIEFLGRFDHQVKVRGFRIELEEIDRALERFPTVKRAATKLVGGGTNDESLAAFVTVASGFSKEGLKQQLSTLP
ncbi:MAG: amino acid adenylation domain-containing protein, partial [Planctomycetota bacterium]